MTRSSIIRYLDTRGKDESHPTFTEVIIKGIAPGGGLYVPERLPRLDLQDIVGLAQMPYAARATYVHAILGVDIPDDRLAELMNEAFGPNFDDPRVAPVAEVADGIHVLELWHGPTSAFKDMALQCMPILFSEAISLRRAGGFESHDYLVLVATSGDTGKAALEGFADRPHTKIVVFYPAQGVSDIQRKQMVTQRGSNVCVFGARGNFDDCQAAVKAVFNDEAFAEELSSSWGLKLSSANSINWGRLVPQIVYYLSAYAELVAKGAVAAGHPVDVCVPTGNFGNILAAWYARRMGAPFERLLCASNENNVLTDFINTGIYDISDRCFVTTPSPSMDILVSSNLERLLYELCGDPGKVLNWVGTLAQEKRFQVDRETWTQIRELFVGDYVTNEDTLLVIRQVWEETGYLLDPHTAVAWEVAERHKDDRPVIVVSTAHWAKFGIDVYKALNGIEYRAPLPADVAQLSGLDLLERVAKRTGQPIPRNLSELRSLPERFTQEVDATADAAREALRKWLAAEF